MKAIFFFFALLAGITANATVKVTPLNANYSAVPPTVTFKVEWQNASIPHNNRVWVWIDFCPVTGTTPATSFSTATVSNPTKTGGNGTITGQTTRGFFIEYANATNAGTTVTATLSNAPTGKFNWCAYGSDYPPNATVNAGGGYTLHGTLPFTINGSTVNTTTFGAGTCITSITDPTGRPDGFAETPAITEVPSPTICYNTAATLTASISSGTTTAMTYTWNIDENITSTTASTKTSQILTVNTTYTVQALNANGCTSNMSSGTIYILSPKLSGESPNECGCANSLINCGTICLTECCDDCADWTTCGFKQIAPKTAGPMYTYSQAVAYCQSKSPINTWRLPTVTEGQCICQYRSSLPITYYNNNNFWTPTVYDGQHHVIIKIWDASCEVSYGRDDAVRPVICVK